MGKDQEATPLCTDNFAIVKQTTDEQTDTSVKD
jgi:hypothetical protein